MNQGCIKVLNFYTPLNEQAKRPVRTFIYLSDERSIDQSKSRSLELRRSDGWFWRGWKLVVVVETIIYKSIPRDATLATPNQSLAIAVSFSCFDSPRLLPADPTGFLLRWPA